MWGIWSSCKTWLKLLSREKLAALAPDCELRRRTRCTPAHPSIENPWRASPSPRCRSRPRTSRLCAPRRPSRSKPGLRPASEPLLQASPPVSGTLLRSLCTGPPHGGARSIPSTVPGVNNVVTALMTTSPAGRCQPVQAHAPFATASSTAPATVPRQRKAPSMARSRSEHLPVHASQYERTRSSDLRHRSYRVGPPHRSQQHL